MASILVISKDPSLRTAIRQALADEPYLCHEVEVPECIPTATNRETPDLAIVDLMSLGPDVTLACRQVRGMPHLSRIPMLCMGRGENARMIAQVLDAGGDDYIRKPFIARELAARVRALMRRATRGTSTYAIILDPEHNTAEVGGQHVTLTPTEFALLEVLCRHRGEHLTAADLLTQVWHYPPGGGDPALVRNHVRNLRRKLERDPNRPRIVLSSHGRGYTVSMDVMYR